MFVYYPEERGLIDNVILNAGVIRVPYLSILDNAVWSIEWVVWIRL